MNKSARRWWITKLEDKPRIEVFLRRSPELHLYSLGDLDDFFWPDTTWYGREDGGQLQDVVLLYKGTAVPTVVGLSQRPEAMAAFLNEIAPLLPERFYAHLSPDVEQSFRDRYRIASHERHYKMALRDTGPVRNVDCSQVVRLTPHDTDDLVRLYADGYPDNWFDTRMLQTGQYFGLRCAGRLVSAAGVHVYSERYRVAALGNIVTHPAWRRRGYGRRTIARLCQSVLEKVEHDGLNVTADNHAAIACYRELGFETIASYGEFTIERRP